MQGKRGLFGSGSKVRRRDLSTPRSSIVSKVVYGGSTSSTRITVETFPGRPLHGCCNDYS